ncbi:hypothetical protein KR009_006842 [Drosophila setifemur]|nr:hypothetical protein KR009_006842 [Drosophila setifemur]
MEQDDEVLGNVEDLEKEVAVLELGNEEGNPTAPKDDEKESVGLEEIPEELIADKLREESENDEVEKVEGNEEEGEKVEEQVEEGNKEEEVEKKEEEVEKKEREEVEKEEEQVVMVEKEGEVETEEQMVEEKLQELEMEEQQKITQKEEEQEPQKEQEEEEVDEENKEDPGQNPIPESSAPEEDLPNDQVTLFLRQLVKQLWPELGPHPELRLERASAKGDNYLGVVWRLQVPCAGSPIGTGSRRSLVVKLPPQNRVRRKQFFARPCFLRETAAYEEFLPLAEQLQEKWRVPPKDRFRQHARCLGTRQDEPNECIVLSDLTASGYVLHNRFLDLSVEQVRLVIRSYARLHALSLAAKRQWPERMHPLQQLVDIFEQRREDHALGVYFENLKGSALSALISPADDTYRARLEAYFSRGSYFQLLLPLVNGSNCEPFAVMCHGDCWNNNILYKVGQRPGELEDVRLIDWQLMRYASPVTDLAYFLFTCTSRTFRQRHMRDMLEEYHAELGQHLTRLGERVDQVLPKSAFEEQVATKSAVGLLLAMMVLPIVTMQGQDVPDLQAISERIEAGTTTDLRGAGFLGEGNEAPFRRRMREVILDCVDFNYI